MMHFLVTTETDDTFSIVCRAPQRVIKMTADLLALSNPEFVIRERDLVTFACANGRWTYRVTADPDDDGLYTGELVEEVLS